MLYTLTTLSLKQCSFLGKPEGLEVGWMAQSYWVYQGNWSPSVSVAWHDDLSQESSPGTVEHLWLIQKSSDELQTSLCKPGLTSPRATTLANKNLYSGTGTLIPESCHSLNSSDRKYVQNSCLTRKGLLKLKFFAGIFQF